MLRAQLTSCCCNPADTPAGRQTDGPTHKPRSGLSVFIASTPMHPHSKLHGQIRPEGKPIANMLFFIVWHPGVRILQVQESTRKNADRSSAITSGTSPSLSHLLERGVYVGLFLSHG